MISTPPIHDRKVIMNRGQPLNQIREELGRNSLTKVDFIVPAKAIHAVPLHNFIIGIEGLRPDKNFPLENHASMQLADFLGIPKPYYTKLLRSSAPLLAANINHWLNKIESPRFFRTVNGVIVAILTERYKVLDNDRLLDAVLPMLEERRCEITSACLTDTRIYIKATTPDISRVIENSKTPNDVVQAGVAVSNSEIGDGQLVILPMIYRTICKNGIIKDIISNGAIRRLHLGGIYEIKNEAYSIEPELVESSRDRKFWDRVQTAVIKSLSEGIFSRMVDNIECAARMELKVKDAPKIVNKIGYKYDLPQSMRDKIHKYLVSGDDYSKWGLVNAVTQAANDFTEYEISTFLEKIGGDLLTCSNEDWRKLGGRILPPKS